MTCGGNFNIVTETGPNPWTQLLVLKAQGDFTFAVMADRSGGIRDGRFEQAIARVNLMQPDFVVHIGDIIEGARNDMAEVNRQWDEALALIGKVEPPFFFCPGNHDVLNPAQLDVWRERIGRAYYHFVYKDVLFLILNSEEVEGKILGGEQADYAAKVLEEHPDVRHTFVFVHVPLWIYGHEHHWDVVERALGSRPCTVFAGHMHEYTHEVREGRSYVILASSGAWTMDRGAALGEFDHLTWVTMRAGEPRIANIALDGIHCQNAQTREMAEELAPLHWGEAAMSTGIWCEGNTFENGETTLRLSNPLQRPLTLDLLMHPNRQCDVRPKKHHAELAPGAEEELKVCVEAVDGMDSVDEVDPIRVTYRASCEFPEREPVVLERTHRIVVDGVHACPRRTAPVQVDGRLDDWDSLPHRCVEPGQIQQCPGIWQGPADASFAFATAHGAGHLYIAVRVYDDVPRFRGRTEPWRKDGLAVRVDARPDGQRRLEKQRWRNETMDGEFSRHFNSNPGPGAFEDYLYFGLSLGATPDATTIYEADRLPEGVQAACAPAEDGWAAEIAIPDTVLDAFQGKSWERFRLNITLFDYDGSFAAPHTALWWRPEWNGPENVADSGTFERR